MDRHKSELQQARSENKKLIQKLQIKQDGEADQNHQETEENNAELQA